MAFWLLVLACYIWNLARKSSLLWL